MEKMGSKLKHRFTVFPQDTNNLQTLFGGKLMAEMDLAAATLCRKLLRTSEAEGAVTRSFSRIDFNAPAHVDDLIEISAELKMLGKSTMRIWLVASKEDSDGKIIKIGSSNATFVSLKEGKSFPHGINWDNVCSEYF